jgi:hypothetical protein
MSTVKWPSCSTENRFFLMTNLAEAPRKFPDQTNRMLFGVGSDAHRHDNH